ncbi:hypothetical protein KIPB_000422 [Kipferlia bialata]|uniref:phosphomevalonate kinase n=1 Tax=Kipferlia bialata TaxID=797122 RepID=A0A9K3CNI0_9EUKA|nr:hypothetical protein KIPB_000422 [Kipferlia bialata]|eukprot:g422.t1
MDAVYHYQYQGQDVVSDPAAVPDVCVQYTCVEPPLTCSVSLSPSLPLLPQLERAVCHRGKPINPFLSNGLAMVLNHVLPEAHHPPLLSLSIRVSPTTHNCFHHTPTHPISLRGATQSTHKTGLGSSSALIACLAEAAYRLGAKLYEDRVSSKAMYTHVHTTHSQPLSSALLCHTAAQGGEGSGYDVATALTAGCLVISKGVPPATLQGLPLGCPLHPSLDVCMLSLAPMPSQADTASGQGGVFSSCNTRKAMATVRDRVPQSAMEAYAALCAKCVHALAGFLSQPSQTSYSASLEALLAVRLCLRGWVDDYGVKVEPTEVTPFLDAVNAHGTHMLGMCPGAGGWDAVCVITWDTDPTPSESLLDLCAQFSLCGSVLPGCSLIRERGLSLFVND